jgi:hypothetical protein
MLRAKSSRTLSAFVNQTLKKTHIYDAPFGPLWIPAKEDVGSWLQLFPVSIPEDVITRFTKRFLTRNTALASTLPEAQRPLVYTTK